MRQPFAWLTVTATLLLLECPAQATDPTTADCLAASDASLTLDNQHKLLAERSQLLICAAATCPADIRKECLRRVDEVNGQIPTIVFEVRDASGSYLSGVKVTMDGGVLSERVEGTALSVDPGEHTFTFEAANLAPVTEKFTIPEGQKERREVITFGVRTTPPSSPLAQPAIAPPVQNPLVTDVHGEDHQSLGTQKVLAIVAGGVGVVGLGIGTAFGVAAISQKSDAQRACPGDSVCPTQDAANKWNSAESSGNVSTVGFVVGSLGIVGAAVLWFTAPSSASMQVGLGPGILQVRGTW